MLHALGIKETCGELMALTVCSLEEESCMMNTSSRCPGPEPLKTFLQGKTSEDDEIKYKRWVRSEKCLLMTAVSSTTEVVEELLEKLENLKRHHYVSKVQSNYLRFLKSTLPPTEAIVIMDFAENYNFIVQDAAQSFHWNSTQATLHPVVAYTRSMKEVPFIRQRIDRLAQEVAISNTTYEPRGSSCFQTCHKTNRMLFVVVEKDSSLL